MVVKMNRDWICIVPLYPGFMPSLTKPNKRLPRSCEFTVTRMRIYEAGLRSAYSRSHRAVIRAYDEARNVIETYEQTLRRGYSITMNALNRTAKLRPRRGLP